MDEAPDFFEKLYWDNQFRLSAKRDLEKDIKYFKLNKSLKSKEKKLISEYFDIKYPIVFIVGVPRSGSTLLSQILIEHLELGFVNNFVARFWMAPIYGSIQFNNLNLKTDGLIDYKSNLGNTKGFISPSEFGFFWQHWYNHVFNDDLSEVELETIDWKSLNQQIHALSSYYSKPLIFKNLNYNSLKIKYISERIDNSIFIHIKRNPVYTIQSILNAREKRYGDINKWWSLRIKNFDALLNKPPLFQISQQYFHIESKITQQLGEVDSDRKHLIDYENLGSDSEILELFSGLNLNTTYKKLCLPNPKNSFKGTKEQLEKIHSNIFLFKDQ